MFQFLTDKVKARTQGWNKRFLSAGGKEVLLKSVAIALPVYAMNIFKLPKDTCEEINSVLSKFWWGDSDTKRNMHWFAWNRMARSKSEGGMGFRDIEHFNLALLGKQVWRILQHPTCLMARLLKARYFSDTSILNATNKRKESFVWKSLIQGRDLLKQGMRFIVGDGSTINAWIDPWLPLHPLRPPQAVSQHTAFTLVKDWIHADTGQWNEELIRELVVEEDANLILSLKLCKQNHQDFLGWHYTKNGIYTVKSAYWLANQVYSDPNIRPPPGNPVVKNKVWKQDTAPKIKHFLWKILSRSLASGENLRLRHISSNSTCTRCCQAEESTQHILFECPYAQMVWRASGLPLNIILMPTNSLEDKMESILSGSIAQNDHLLHQLAIRILWRLWTSRNYLVFQQRNYSWFSTLVKARQDAEEWQQAQEYIQSLDCEVTNQRLINRTATTTTRLQQLPVGWTKCNYDGSYNMITRQSKAGWVLKNERGDFIDAGQATGMMTTSPLDSELQALLIAMQHSWCKGFRKVSFEGDCKSIPEILNGKTLNFGCYNWIKEINHWKTRFEEVDFTWTPRNNNRPADLLAKKAIPNNSSYNVFSCIPSFLQQVL